MILPKTKNNEQRCFGSNCGNILHNLLFFGVFGLVMLLQLSVQLQVKRFCAQGYYMERKGISLGKSSVALTLLSLSEFVTYVVASVLGDNLKGRLIYANVVSSSCLAVICIAWPFTGA